LGVLVAGWIDDKAQVANGSRVRPVA